MIDEESVQSNKQRDGNCKTILLVEDEELMREFLEIVLRERGYRVLSAQNGLEALNLYRVRGKEVDLILSDIEMPLLDGASAYLQLKEINPSVRVIFASGSLNVDLWAELQRSGAKYFIRKPFGPDELFLLIREALKES